MLPNFIIIGAMKCGTTSLAHYLSQHPEVFVSSPENIYFFGADENFKRGLSYYESFFEGAQNYRAIGEASDDYTKALMKKSQLASQRIKKILPDVKLIFLAKHPLKQIESSWLQRVADSSEVLPFNKAVLESKFQYVETANYLRQLSFYYEKFNSDQIRVFFTEDLSEDPSKVLLSCLDFLGVEKTVSGIDLTHLNVSLDKSYDRSMTKIIRNSSYLVQLAQNAPSPLKLFLKKTFTQSLKQKPSWNPETLEIVCEAIWDDSIKFLIEHNKSNAFWTLEEYQ